MVPPIALAVNILVLDAARLIEFRHPSELLSDHLSALPRQTSASAKPSAEPPPAPNLTVVLQSLGLHRNDDGWRDTLTQLGQFKRGTVIMVDLPPGLDVPASFEAPHRSVRTCESVPDLKLQPARSPRLLRRNEQSTEDRAINPAQTVELAINVRLRCSLVAHAPSVAMIELR